MKIVADASPLIFLAKVRRLDLIKKVVGTGILVTRSVHDEAAGHDVEPEERRVLAEFLGRVRIGNAHHGRRFAKAMSRADNDTLSLALECGAEMILCDDRLLRTYAESEGIRAIGTLGIVLRAMRTKHITAGEARRIVETLVGSHGFRISVEVYQTVMAEISG